MPKNSQHLTASFLIIIVFVLVVGLLFVFIRQFPLSEYSTDVFDSEKLNGNMQLPAAVNAAAITNTDQSEDAAQESSQIPIDRANERITKKPFGIYITPHESPIQQERFSGYHTGTDFEIFPEETDANVAVRAFCSGYIRAARWVSGYGGVVVQECSLIGQQVTVLYGHLNIASVGKKISDALQEGELIGMLGKGYSNETDGERKHLHFGIHRGTQVSFLGYVPVEGQLGAWIDPETLLAS